MFKSFAQSIAGVSILAIGLVGVAHADKAITVEIEYDRALLTSQAGAQDVIEKPYDGAELMRRIAELGEAARGDGEETARFGARFGALTPREREVLVEIVAGHSTKMIAHRLGLSPKTVEVHRARILSKTGAGNLSTLVRLAIKAGIEPVAESGG